MSVLLLLYARKTYCQNPPAFFQLMQNNATLLCFDRIYRLAGGETPTHLLNTIPTCKDVHTFSPTWQSQPFLAPVQFVSTSHSLPLVVHHLRQSRCAHSSWPQVAPRWRCGNSRIPTGHGRCHRLGQGKGCRLRGRRVGPV